MSDDFGSTLRGLRQASGLTQEQLAEGCGLSVDGISALERGHRRRPRASTVDALVRGLGLDADAAEALRAACATTAPAPRETAAGPFDRATHVRPGWRLRPAQLPAAPATYVGRDELVDRLVGRLREPDGLAPHVVGITGMPGIGKTSLALRVGHAVADRFPDGQIYLDLRGHHPAGALTTQQALAYLLTSLGMHADDLPSDLQQTVACYRTLTSGTRLLLVLDDAGDDAELDLLVPGTGGSAVLLISRSSLPGGPATETHHLGRLATAEAGELLARLVGAERVIADHEAVDRLVTECAGLPLALRIAAARLQSHPSWTVAELADRLAEGGPLVELQCGSIAIEPTLGESIEQLRGNDDEVDGAAAQALSVIGLLPTYAVSPVAVAAACAWSRQQAQTAIDRLVETSLVEESASGACTVHDLVHAVARDRAHTDLTPAARHAVRMRVLRHYTALAWRSRSLSRPVPPGIDGAALEAGLDPDLAPEQCLELIAPDAEQLASLIRVCAGHDAETDLAIGRLVLGLITYFAARADNVGWPETVRLALDHLPDDALDERIWLLQDLALAQSGRGDHRPAIASADEAARLARAHGRPVAEATALTAASIALRRLDRMGEALERCRRALALCQEGGDGRATAAVWRDLGQLEAASGDLPAGIRSTRRSLVLYRRLQVPRGIAMALINLGVMLRDTGALEESRALLEEGVEVSRSVGDRALETEALDELGFWHLVTGDARGGISVLSDGLALVDDRGVGQWETSIRRRLGLALDGLGRHEEAEEHWHLAIRRHEQRGELRQAAEVRQLLAARSVSMSRTGPTRAATSRRTSSA